MNQQQVIEIATKAIITTLEVSLPMLGVALVIGLFISLFQALTQIQEMTLPFIFKVLAMVGTLALLGPWMLSTLLTYTRDLYLSIPGIIAGGG